MKVVKTQIEINAPAERVWSIMTDFAAFPQWNPFISNIEGAPTVGTKLRVRLTPPGGRAVTFKPRVRAVEANQELRWLGHLGIPGLFDGEHSFTIEPVGEGRVLFRHEECFGGLLLPMLKKMLDRETTSGFHAMNEALKKRAEGGA